MEYSDDPRKPGAFYLVQTLSYRPYRDHQRQFPKAKVKSNPFGYGRMGDYELDYMGAAEFEFGAIPAANNRLANAGKKLVIEKDVDFRGSKIDLIFNKKEGNPIPVMEEWAKGANKHMGPFCGKERPYVFEARLKGEKRYNGEDWDINHPALWWALEANVLWGFSEDGHIERYIESMGSSPTEFLR